MQESNEYMFSEEPYGSDPGAGDTNTDAYDRNMGNPSGYGPYNAPPFQSEPEEKQDRQVLGIVSLICGIAALTFFCACINIPLAAVSFGFGSVQIMKYRQKWPAIIGMVLSGISLFLMMIAIFAFATLNLNMDVKVNPDDPGGYEEYFKEYLEKSQELEDESL